MIHGKKLDAAGAGPVTTMLTREDTSCTGRRTTAAAEVNAGTVNNSATANGNPPVGGPTTSAPDATNTPIAATPSLTIDKTAGVPSGAAAGSTINYTFLVTNTGNVTITGIVIDDVNIDAAAVCPVTTLLPGENTTCTGTHTITQAEVNAGTVNKVLFDNKIHVVRHALGLHTAVSRVQGNRLTAKHEIRIAAMFKQAPDEFLRMIVLHELAHLREKDHGKAFYQLCTHMEPQYHQLEFDTRLWLTQLSLGQDKI